MTVILLFGYYYLGFKYQMIHSVIAYHVHYILFILVMSAKFFCVPRPHLIRTPSHITISEIFHIPCPPSPHPRKKKKKHYQTSAPHLFGTREYVFLQ